MEFIADTFYNDNEPEKQANWYGATGNKPPTTQYVEGMKSLQNMIDVQSQPGNWDWDPYMQGLMNGLLLAKSCFEHHSDVLLQLKSAPDKWVNPNEINYEIDSLKEQILKICEKYYDRHIGEIAPSDFGVQFHNNNVNLIDFRRISDPIIGKEDTYAKHPYQIEIGPQATPYYAECDTQKESCDTCFRPFDYTATNSVSAEI